MAKKPIEVEALKHDAATRRNIPTAEFESVMREADKTPIRLAYAQRNRDLDPQLVWRGKDEQDWSDRMICGDSLSVMASLAEREGLRGQVQCLYFDPPYGIKFNSNFQWSTTSRDAIALACSRLMGARYPYDLLADSPEGQRKEGEVTLPSGEPAPAGGFMEWDIPRCAGEGDHAQHGGGGGCARYDRS